MTGRRASPQSDGGRRSSHQSGGGGRGSGAGRGISALAPEFVVGVLAVAVFGWSVGGPDPWTDELATLKVASWPIGGIMTLAEHKDLVHLAYYLLVHPVWILDHSIVAVRLVSVAAMAGAAVALVRIGRALDGWPVGAAAGVMFSASAMASRYAQEARPYALVALLATVTTLALIRAVQSPFRKRRWVIYAALLVATGVVNIMGMLIAVAHAVWVCWVPVPRRGAVILRWGVSMGVAGGMLAPFALRCLGQIAQVGGIPHRPLLAELGDFAEWAWPSLGGAPPGWQLGLFTAIAAVVVGVWGSPGARRALVLGLAWGLIPPLALGVASQIHPLYRPRYVLVAVPGIALALGSLAGLRFARRLPRGVAVAVAVVLIPAVALALAGLPLQQSQRLSDGHDENFRRIAQILATESRRGDGIVALPFWYTTAFKTGFPLPAGMDEITVDRDGPSTATIEGWEVGPRQAHERLEGYCRVWTVTREGNPGRTPTDAAVVQELSTGFERVENHSAGDFDVELFVSRAASCRSPG